jgi:hypothetical protein
MALDSGKVCASQVINDNSQPDVGGNTHVVTYWRGSGANDWTNELGYPFIGQIKTSGAGGRQSATWYYFPLFSPAGVTNLDTNVIQTAMRFTNFHQGSFSNDMQTYMSSANGTNGFIASPGLNHPKCVQIPLLGGRTSPPVGWVYMHQEKRRVGSTLTNTSPAVRIAWFTEDLEGLIDAERMGGLTTRPSGTNSEEISLSSATGIDGALLSSVANFTNNRKTYVSFGLLSTTDISGLANPTNARYFASGLRAWAPTNPASPTNGALAWIPVGIPISGSSTDPRGYTNQGYTKLNLNNLITNSGSTIQAVANITAAITNNLPRFTNRAGGFAISAAGGATNTNAYTGTAYLQTLAANIIDYADADSDPTTDGTTLATNRVRPVYRGVDSYPFITEINKRYLLLSNNVTNEAGTNGRLAVVATTDFIEVWNPSSQTVPAGTLVFVSAHRQPVNFGFSSSSFATPTRASNSLGAVSNGVTTNTFPALTLQPNEFRALACPTVTNFFFVANTNPATFSMQDERTNSQYWVSWNGRYYDAGLGGISRNSGTLAVGTPTNRSQMPGFIYRTLGAFDPPAVGDPRATIYLSRILDANAYSANSTFGGRNRRAGTVAPGLPYYEVAPATWPDGGHNSPPGNPAGNDNTLPTAVTPATYSNVPPGRISNAGSFSNIFELGAIFDPMQWRDPGLGSWQGKYTNLSTAGVADNGYGGGNTLRIGRPEHPRFAFTNFGGAGSVEVPNMGMSAAALLDLFCLTNGTSVGGGPYTLGGGKINLNTAPAPVLRALAGGIRLTQDPSLTGVGGSGTNFPVPPSMAEAFAQGVMRFRSKYPFLTPSHLSFIGTDPAWPNTTTWPANAVFGNTNSIALSSAPGNTFGTSARINVTAWNDQAAEEWLSKIYALSSCQSHNYRIYVVAQLVATNSSGQTNAIGPLVKKYFQIYARNGSSVTPYPDVTSYPNNTISSWKPTVGTIDIFKSSY